MARTQKTTHGAAIGDTSKANAPNASELVTVISSKSNASQSVSRAAIGDTGNNDNPTNTSVNGTATANMEDGVATTPDMPQAWSDTFMERDLEDYARKLVLSVTERLRARLQGPNKVGNIVLSEGSLNEQKPIDVANAGQNPSLKSYREPWKGPNCIVSLEANGLYVAAGNAFFVESCPSA